jgi:hypothetical protein
VCGRRIFGSVCHLPDTFELGAPTHPSADFVSAEHSMRNKSRSSQIKSASVALQLEIIAWRNRPMRRSGFIGRSSTAMVYSNGR